MKLATRYPIRLLCRLLSVPRSTVYYHSESIADESMLKTALLDLAAEWPTFGYRRLTEMMRRLGWPVNAKRVRRWMDELNLTGVPARRTVKTANSNHDFPRYENLVSGLDISRPDQVWVAEIVYSQMTKPAGLAGRCDWEHIADLDIVPRHHDSVDEQFDQLALSLKRRCVETLPYPF